MSTPIDAPTIASFPITVSAVTDERRMERCL